MKILSAIAVSLICIGVIPFSFRPAEEATQITFHESDDYHTRWAPDGKMIGYVSRETGNSDIWVIKVPAR